MPIPLPQLGLVISYTYLWHHEHQVGREEGRENRPCVIVLALEHTDDGTTMVAVLPITHAAPRDPALAVELPRLVKQHLGLDGERSWVLLHEGNEFTWPGYDLKPLPGARDRFDCEGGLPPFRSDPAIFCQ
ncbi:growth inhibitor PemK [Oleomonas cavernae]|uniref:growth inhibitor PemK n=1 Tax=Oleomonas cavernae TaxID=2320859 RepID=UPI0011C4753C|nr:growth inhibitor PemK [Oleomonas cavernae]